MGAAAAGQLEDALDAGLAALGDDVGGAELAPELRAGGVATEQDDPVRAEALGCDHAAQPDGAVADDGGDAARRDARAKGCVVAGAHHVGERQQRRHQRIVGADGELDERAVGEGHADGLALTAVDVAPAPEPAVLAGRRQPVEAAVAGAVGVRERRDDEVADLQRLHVGAELLDDPDEFVSHPLRLRLDLGVPVAPEVAAADARAGDAQHHIRCIHEPRVGHVFDPNVACTMENRCAHCSHRPLEGLGGSRAGRTQCASRRHRRTEREGFEPSRQVNPIYTISNRAPSTTRTPLQRGAAYRAWLSGSPHGAPDCERDSKAGPV